MILSLYNVQCTEYLNDHNQFKWLQRNLCVAFVHYHTAHWLVRRRLKVEDEKSALVIWNITVLSQVNLTSTPSPFLTSSSCYC